MVVSLPCDRGPNFLPLPEHGSLEGHERTEWALTQANAPTALSESIRGMQPHLTSSLDAQDGHTGDGVALELVHQVDPLGGRDTAVNADVAHLGRWAGVVWDRARNYPGTDSHHPSANHTFPIFNIHN